MNRCVTIEKQWTTGTHPSKYYINKAQKNTYHIQSSLPESGRITRSTVYYITVRWYQLTSCFPILPAWLYYHSSSCAVFIMLTKHWSSKESAECFCTSSPELLQMTCWYRWSQEHFTLQDLMYPFVSFGPANPPHRCPWSLQHYVYMFVRSQPGIRGRLTTLSCLCLCTLLPLEHVQ